MPAVLAPQRSAALPDIERLSGRAPRTSLPDRIAMSIGLKLLLWGTRPRSLETDHDRRRRLAEAERARDELHLQYAHSALSMYGR